MIDSGTERYSVLRYCVFIAVQNKENCEEELPADEAVMLKLRRESERWHFQLTSTRTTHEHAHTEAYAHNRCMRAHAHAHIR
eukprot:2253593-Pleurochrysis_carterae.AAC.1